ncbi:MAG: hypothetical protein JOZ62_06070, partial [Acidobacteriaceae bacterium]|nr:hypothetical protein [Acidobacteriaceae bacterium]
MRPIVLVAALGSAMFLLGTAFRGAAQLAPSPLNTPSAVGPPLTKPGERVAWLSGLTRLGLDQRQDDFPSIAAGADGTIWAVWASYSGLYDEIHARTYRNGAWSTIFPVPGVTGDVWMPQVAIDASGKPWFVWSQQVDYPPRDPERVNWDIYAVRYEGDRWGKVERLTNDPGPDINPRLKRDARGRIWLVWQG